MTRRTSAKWMLAPGGRVAHRWTRGEILREWFWTACGGRAAAYVTSKANLRPPGKAKRCSKCAKGASR